MLKYIMYAVLLAVFVTISYAKGYMVLNTKIAVAFIGKRGPGLWGASVTACSGWVKRGLSLTAGKEYSFCLESTLTGGTVTVQLLHKGKPIYTLDENSTQVCFTAEKGLYSIKTTFSKADGSYRLKWHETDCD